jgi:hypothetical protein
MKVAVPVARGCRDHRLNIPLELVLSVCLLLFVASGSYREAPDDASCQADTVAGTLGCHSSYGSTDRLVVARTFSRFGPQSCAQLSAKQSGNIRSSYQSMRAAVLALLLSANAAQAAVLRVLNLEFEIRSAQPVLGLLGRSETEKHVHVTPSSPYFPWYIAAIIILVLLVRLRSGRAHVAHDA